MSTYFLFTTVEPAIVERGQADYTKISRSVHSMAIVAGAKAIVVVGEVRSPSSIWT